MADETQTGNEAIDEISTKPNLDFFFERNPKSLTDEELRHKIEIERQQRAMFIEKKSK